MQQQEDMNRAYQEQQNMYQSNNQYITDKYGGVRYNPNWNPNMFTTTGTGYPSTYG